MSRDELKCWTTAGSSALMIQSSFGVKIGGPGSGGTPLYPTMAQDPGAMMSVGDGNMP